jgi:hypothetical protein
MTSRSIFVALLLFIACRETVIPVRDQNTTTITTTSAAPPKDLSGEKVDTTVTVAPAPVTDCQVKLTFAASEQVDFTMQLAEAPAELQASVRILQDEKEIDVVEAPAEGKQTVTMRLPKLKPGKYKLEGIWGGNVGCEREVDVTR